MLQKLMDGRSTADQERLHEALCAQVPLGRIAEPTEIADLLVFAASDESRFMTGSELVIDGGLTAM
jgi:NAD(P)-dependent dehydrogenase (short-subunit alcohol dehydrogenase family)